MSLRAVIYARCSTDEEAQKDALIAQAAEARECVRLKGWTLVDEYVESVSGTLVDARREYTRLKSDMQRDVFDVIVIKSQDRLMRNTMEWFIFLDLLIREKKQLFMYLENKFYSSDDSLITGIKAILAEEYSRELSKKINNAHRNRQANNGTVILTNNTFGYKKLLDKSIIIDEKERELIETIYKMAASGYGSRSIAIKLKNQGYLNRQGKQFADATIRRIIRNPLYKGTVVMNQSHHDFATKQTLKQPKEEHIIYENKVPAIVDEDLWNLANAEIDKRCNTKMVSEKASNAYTVALRGKVVCGLCGESYYRRTRVQRKDGQRAYIWMCRRYVETGRVGEKAHPTARKVQFDNPGDGCNNIHLNEQLLLDLILDYNNDSSALDHEMVIQDMVTMLRSVLKEDNMDEELHKKKSQCEKLINQKDILLEKLIDGIISDDTYKNKVQDIDSKINDLTNAIGELSNVIADKESIDERIRKIEAILRKGDGFKNVALQELLKAIDKIYVYPDYLEISLSLLKPLTHNKSGQDNSRIRINLDSRFSYAKQKKDKRECLIALIRENPKSTIKMLADKMEVSVSGISYMIKVLKKDGRLSYSTKNGKGYWIIKDE